MTTQTEALKLAIDLANMHHTDYGYLELRSKVRQLAKEALANHIEDNLTMVAQQSNEQVEPVAWITQGGKGWLRWHKSYDDNKDSVPLYTTPPPVPTAQPKEPEQEPVDEPQPDGVVVGFNDEGQALVDHDGLEEGWVLYTTPPQPAQPEQELFSPPNKFYKDVDEVINKLEKNGSIFDGNDSAPYVVWLLRTLRELAAQTQPKEPKQNLKLMPREATPEMLKAMDECSTEGYDERLYEGHAGSVYMAAWDAFHGQHCYCGDITSLGVIHRDDGPCHYPDHKEPEQEPVAKLKVTLEDRPIDIELAQYKRMFEAACSALGAIGEALGIDEEEGGAEPILAAIEELKAQPKEPEQRSVSEHLEPVACVINGKLLSYKNTPMPDDCFLYEKPHPHRPSRSDIKPLTDEQIRSMEFEHIRRRDFARAIEAAHGITKE